LFIRFIQYNPTSLERGHKHELHTEVDLGVPIDLILPETYATTGPDSESVIDPIPMPLLAQTVSQLSVSAGPDSESAGYSYRPHPYATAGRKFVQ
jgi:hypothetical protein